MSSRKRSNKDSLNGKDSNISQSVLSSSSNLNSNLDDEQQQQQQTQTQTMDSQNSKQRPEIILKKSNLGPNGAYLTSQKLKKFYNVQLVDLAENSFQDEGVIYVALSLKLCLSLAHLNLSSNLMTSYGFRILLENINRNSLKHLDVSGNPIGSSGMDYMAKYLEETDCLEYLNLSSINLEEEGAKKIGVAISMNATVKKIDLSWNHIRVNGSVVLAKGLSANNSIQELNLSYNGLGLEGVIGISECIKYKTNFKAIDLSCTRLTYECAIHLANALKVNTTLNYLDLSNNQLTTTGVYYLLHSVNTDESNLKYLGLKVRSNGYTDWNHDTRTTVLKNVPILKHVFVIIELIQQKRRFQCDVGPLVIYADNLNGNQAIDDDPMMKLARFLTDKRLRLIDMLRILDKKQNLKMPKEEFIKRLKIFEPRLKNRDIFSIADSLSKSDLIDYENLYRQANSTSTKEDIIAHENSLIRIRLQTLKKNRIYMKNIEQQFTNLLQEREIAASKSSGLMPRNLLTLSTIDDWLKETHEDETGTSALRPYKRKPSLLIPLQNRTTLLRSQNALQDIYLPKQQQQQQQESQKSSNKLKQKFNVQQSTTVSEASSSSHRASSNRQILKPLSKSSAHSSIPKTKTTPLIGMNSNETEISEQDGSLTIRNDSNDEAVKPTNNTNKRKSIQLNNSYNPTKIYRNAKSKITSQYSIRKPVQIEKKSYDESVEQNDDE